MKKFKKIATTILFFIPLSFIASCEIKEGLQKEFIILKKALQDDAVIASIKNHYSNKNPSININSAAEEFSKKFINKLLQIFLPIYSQSCKNEQKNFIPNPCDCLVKCLTVKIIYLYWKNLEKIRKSFVKKNSKKTNNKKSLLKKRKNSYEHPNVKPLKKRFENTLDSVKAFFTTNQSFPCNKNNLKSLFQNLKDQAPSSKFEEYIENTQSEQPLFPFICEAKDKFYRELLLTKNFLTKNLDIKTDCPGEIQMFFKSTLTLFPKKNNSDFTTFITCPKNFFEERYPLFNSKGMAPLLQKFKKEYFEDPFPAQETVYGGNNCQYHLWSLKMQLKKKKDMNQQTDFLINWEKNLENALQSDPDRNKIYYYLLNLEFLMLLAIKHIKLIDINNKPPEKNHGFQMYTKIYNFAKEALLSFKNSLLEDTSPYSLTIKENILLRSLGNMEDQCKKTIKRLKKITNACFTNGDALESVKKLLIEDAQTIEKTIGLLNNSESCIHAVYAFLPVSCPNEFPVPDGNENEKCTKFFVHFILNLDNKNLISKYLHNDPIIGENPLDKAKAEENEKTFNQYLTHPCSFFEPKSLKNEFPPVAPCNHPYFNFAISESKNSIDYFLNEEKTHFDHPIIKKFKKFCKDYNNSLTPPVIDDDSIIDKNFTTKKK